MWFSGRTLTQYINLFQYAAPPKKVLVSITFHSCCFGICNVPHVSHLVSAWWYGLTASPGTLALWFPVWSSSCGGTLRILDGRRGLGGVPHCHRTRSFLFVWSCRVTFLPCLAAFFSFLRLSPRDKKKIPCCLDCSLKFVSNIESGPFFKNLFIWKIGSFFFFQEMTNNASLLLCVLGLACLKT